MNFTFFNLVYYLCISQLILESTSSRNNNNTDFSYYERLFINKHILNPKELRNHDYTKWKSEEWSNWLLEHNNCDGLLRKGLRQEIRHGHGHQFSHGKGRRSSYGTLLNGRNISIVIGEPTEILRSVLEFKDKESGSYKNSFARAFAIGTAEQGLDFSAAIQQQQITRVRSKPGINLIQSSKQYTIYRFISLLNNRDFPKTENLFHAKPQNNSRKNFIEYSVYIIRNVSFEVLVMRSGFAMKLKATTTRSIRNNEDSTSNSTNTLELLEFYEIQLEPSPKYEKQNFTVRIYFNVKEFEQIHPKSIASINFAKNSILDKRTAKFIMKYPQIFIRTSSNRHTSIILDEIIAINGTELLQILSQLNSTEKYLIFELIKRNQNLIIFGSTKFKLLSKISEELALSSINSMSTSLSRTNIVIILAIIIRITGLIIINISHLQLISM